MKRFSAFFLVLITSYSFANPSTEWLQLSPAVTKNTQLAYFVYREQPRCCKTISYCRGGYLNVPCQKRCLINRYGEVIRCRTYCC